MIYRILGSYRGHTAEVLDEFESRSEAEQMLVEYHMAYGPDWAFAILEVAES